MLQVSGNQLAVDYDPRIAGMFPDAKEITHAGNRLLLLPHNPPSTIYLRSIGHDVPAPVLTQYNWPSPFGKSPYDVQKRTVALMTTAKRCYVLNGLGTGKTRCTLWAFDFLKKCGFANKMLVVAPLSTLWFVWEREAFQVFPHFKVNVLFGSKEKRLKALDDDADIYVINHDGVRTIQAELDARKDIDTLALDELSVYRNGGAERTKAMRKFAAGKTWVWGLTGSPMPREVTDVWGQAVVVTPHTVPKYFSHLQQQLMYKAGPYRWMPRQGAVEEAFKALQPSVRFSLDDVLELPEQVIQYIEVPLGKKQEQLYRDMKNKAVAMIDAKTIDAMNAGAALSKLLQIALGWVYTRDGQTIKLDNEARIQTILDQVEGSQRKVLIFLPFKSALAGMSEALEKIGVEHCVVSGDTPAGKRKELFADFQTTERYKALVAHPGCLAHGLTLTAADTIIWGGPVTNLETFLQANGRITRIGQTHRQLIQMIGGTPAEKKIYEALGKKEAVQMHFLDLLAEASK